MTGERVRVYRNLHRSKPGMPVYSVMSMATKKVIGHVQEIRLSGVRFVVSQAGRARVLRERRKNVHAFVEGRVANLVMGVGTRVTYNPYLYETFVTMDQTPVHQAAYARLNAVGVQIFD